MSLIFVFPVPRTKKVKDKCLWKIEKGKRERKVEEKKRKREDRREGGRKETDKEDYTRGQHLKVGGELLTDGSIWRMLHFLSFNIFLLPYLQCFLSLFWPSMTSLVRPPQRRGCLSTTFFYGHLLISLLISE